MCQVTASYLTWSNKFVIEYYINDQGLESKRTRRATKKDLNLHYLKPRPIIQCS
jgi:hypothetical protein